MDNPSDGNGVGVVSYSITQQCFAGNCTGGTFFTSYDASVYDNTVQPGALYRYSIAATDFHGNLGPSTSFWVATPPAGSIDPHRVGVQRTGNYWGGAGEHIDLVSGNLNFTIPLVTAVGRNGLTATFALSHNSQNWRNAYGINRMLGADTGYGFGWQLMLGSLLPVWGRLQGAVLSLYGLNRRAIPPGPRQRQRGLGLAEQRLRVVRFQHQPPAFPKWNLLGDGLHVGGRGTGRRHALSNRRGRQQRQPDYYRLLAGRGGGLEQFQLSHQHHRGRPRPVGLSVLLQHNPGPGRHDDVIPVGYRQLRRHAGELRREYRARTGALRAR